MKTIKNYIKGRLIYLPRPFRIWWGKCFMYMLGRMGTHEFDNDINLFSELSLWIDEKGKPYKK